MIPLIIIFQLILNTSVGLAWILPRSSQTVPYGITVDGHEVGGFNREQLVAYLYQNNASNIIDTEMVIKNGSREWYLATKDFDFRYDYGKTVDAILQEPPWADSHPMVLSLLKLQARKLELPFEISWHEDRLDTFLASINEETMIPARNASLHVVDGKVLIVDGQSGEQTDFESTTENIIRSIRSNNGEIVNIVKKTIMPEIVSEDLTAVDSVVAVFDTEIDIDNDNRTDNVILASQMLDGTIIMPGDIFSFNEVIGERSLETGFKNAPVIIGGSVQQDVGGGICQVATTLYNASLLTGLEIVERSPHTIPVKYAPHGQDATVFYGQIDLKIKNSLSNPVMINSIIENSKLMITIYGNHQNT